MNKRAFAVNVLRYRWWIVLLMPLCIVVLFALNVKNAGVETDFKIWFDADSQIMKNFEHFKETFGSDDRLMIAMKSDHGVFTKEVLKSIQQMTDALWQTKFVARVDSITNFQYVHVNPDNEDEIIVENFLNDIDALTSEELESKENIARKDVQTKNLLVSQDGKSAVIIARMVYSKHLNPNDYISLYRAANSIIDTYKVDGVEYHNVGVPAYTNAFMETISSNAKLFFPIFLGTIIFLLALIFRSIWGVILPISVVILTILFVAGFTFALGYKLNTITSMFPIFIIATGIADSVHIFWTWLHKRETGVGNARSIIFTLEKNLIPALITSLTTFVGFLSLALSKIVPLQAFGLLLASGAVGAYLLSVLFLPAFLSILKPRVRTKDAKTQRLQQWSKSYTRFIVRYDKVIIAVCAVGTLFCSFGIKNVSVDTEFAKQFDEKTPIRKSAEFVEKNIGGTISLELIVDSKEKSGINQPQLMKDVDAFSEAFMKRFDRIRHVNSLTQVVKKYHQLMNGGDEAFYRIPDSKELISQYLLLYSLSLPSGMGINDMMDVDQRYLRVTAMMNIASEAQKLEMYRWTKAWWKENSTYGATLEGITMISGHMRIQLTETMIWSIISSLLLVTFIFGLAVRSGFFMLISALPNLAPLLIAVGLTGWLDINLDLGMAIVFVIIIGIATDDTVHFLSKYKEGISHGKTPMEAIEWALNFSASAIVITTLILVIGFGTFLWSDFAVYKNFGFLSSIALVLAMVFDLVLVPASLSFLSDRKGKTV